MPKQKRTSHWSGTCWCKRWICRPLRIELRRFWQAYTATDGPVISYRIAPRAPNGFARVGDVISQDELDVVAKSSAAAAGLNVETINHRPSYLSP
jgi:hypothetical protein